MTKLFNDPELQAFPYFRRSDVWITLVGALALVVLVIGSLQ